MIQHKTVRLKVLTPAPQATKEFNADLTGAYIKRDA